MQPFSLSFAQFVIVGLVVFHARRDAAWRRAVLASLNLVFLATFADSWLELVPLAGFIGLSVVAVQLMSRSRELALCIVSIAALLVTYLHLKHYAIVGFLKPLEFGYVTAGLGYMIFRVLHVLIDCYQMPDQPRDASPWKFFNYLTSFLTFTAGPVQRYEDYLADDQELASTSMLSIEDVQYAFGRISDGLLRLGVLGPYMLIAHHYCRDRIHWHMFAFGLAALFYMLFIFLNFSGYMGLMIGIGRLFGRRLPENFDSPFLAANFLDFWNRWHITVSQWFKTYVFNNLLGALCRRWPQPALLPYFGVAGYFIVFFILGLWHDWGHCFLLLALLQAFGVSLNKLWEVELRRHLGRQRHAALVGRLWYRMLARALCLAYFTMSTIPAWEGARYGDLLQYAQWTGVGGIVLNFLACVLGFLSLEAAARLGLVLWTESERWLPRARADFSSQLIISTRIFVLVLLMLPDAPKDNPHAFHPGMVQRGAHDDSILHAASVFYGRNR
jgi:D-alanyl-lipoteichoic acid acyltransferase DltB (MBOAT superfamily)